MERLQKAREEQAREEREREQKDITDRRARLDALLCDSTPCTSSSSSLHTSLVLSGIPRSASPERHILEERRALLDIVLNETERRGRCEALDQMLATQEKDDVVGVADFYS